MATTQNIPINAESAEDRPLSEEQLLRFHIDGWLGPFRAFSEDEMDALRPEVERVLATDPPDHKLRVHNRHLDEPVIATLATAPAMVSRMAQILGHDLLIWRTNFWVKEPGAKEIPWHQDRNYWPLEPSVVISGWLAIDPATVESSCVQVIPGSHRQLIPHVPSDADKAFGEQADPTHVDAAQAVNMELRPGEFFLFTERLLHHSNPPNRDRRRIGLSTRVIPPTTRVLDYDAPNHGVVTLCGEDPMGFNRHAELASTCA